MESEAPKPRGNSSRRWIIAAAVLVQRFVLLAVALLVGLVLYVFLVPGSFLSRPVPSQAEYIASYMRHFDASQIERIDYFYEGAIGGVRTAARVQFKGPVKINEGIEIGAYDPGTVMKEPAASEFKHRCEFHCGRTTPAWFDFPFDRHMRVIREVREESRDAIPPYENEWYIDDQRNVLYFLGNWG